MNVLTDKDTEAYYNLLMSQSEYDNYEEYEDPTEGHTLSIDEELQERYPGSWIEEVE